MKILLLESSFHTEYQSYVLQHPASMLYHSLPYLLFIEKLIDAKAEHYIALDEHKSIQGVLPLFYFQGALGKVYNSLPYYGSNGAVLYSSDEAKFALFEKFNSIAKDRDTAAATMISNPNLQEDLNTLVQSTHQDYRIGQFSNIETKSNTEEELMTRFHYKTRNMIRKAEKQELTLLTDPDALDFIEATHIENMNEIGGKAKSPKFFKLFPDYFEAEKDYKIYIAKLGEQRIAGLLLFYFKNTVEYYTPVIKSEHRDKQALSLLIYRAMVDASKNGFTNWNWGGTWESQEGVHTFKKRWGTEEKKYYYFTQVNRQEIFDYSPMQLLEMYPGFFVFPFNKASS